MSEEETRKRCIVDGTKPDGAICGSYKGWDDTCYESNVLCGYSRWVTDAEYASWNTRSQAEAPEDWEKELGVLLRGMTLPDQIVSHVKSLLKAEREKVLGEIEEVNKQIPHCANCRGRKTINNKIAEIRGE